MRLPFLCKALFFSLVLISTSGKLLSQIIPPALGETQTNSWFAIGLKQDLDKSENGWQSVTYAGLGTRSGSTHQPFDQLGIGVINQEFYHQFKENWQYSLALSYRKQYLFSKNDITDPSIPKYKQEFRVYGRLSYTFHLQPFDITPTLRQEFMKYFTPKFDDYTESMRLRTRFRLKFSWPIQPKHRQKIILYSEQLFATSKSDSDKKWDRFQYTDSRFSLYYSIHPEKTPLTFNLGYMHNLIGTKETFSGHYFALDIIWNNPFNFSKTVD